MKRFIALGVAVFSFAGTAAAIDYPEERGVVPSVIPPAPDETGRVNNVPQWRSVTPVTPAAPVAAGNSIDDYFARYDANHDGVITWNEAQVDPELVRAFNLADTNSDGVLTRAEFQEAAMIAIHNRNAAGG
jgi:EF hand domain-containing protein